jgi:hypothetical protein
MELPKDLMASNPFKPTPWEMAMSKATGKPPTFFRVPRDNAAVLTPEQCAKLVDQVSEGSKVHRMLKKRVQLV